MAQSLFPKSKHFQLCQFSVSSLGTRKSRGERVHTSATSTVDMFTQTCSAYSHPRTRMGHLNVNLPTFRSSAHLASGFITLSLKEPRSSCKAPC